jgi:hypothetical protein
MAECVKRRCWAIVEDVLRFRLVDTGGTQTGGRTHETCQKLYLNWGCEGNYPVASLVCRDATESNSETPTPHLVGHTISDQSSDSNWAYHEKEFRVSERHHLCWPF